MRLLTTILVGAPLMCGGSGSAMRWGRWGALYLCVEKFAHHGLRQLEARDRLG